MKAMPMMLLVPLSGLLFASYLGAQSVGGNWEQLQRIDGGASLDQIGTQIGAAGDIDGDGVPDVILGANYSSPNGLFQAGSAFVYSGQTGSLLWRFDGSNSAEWLGHSTAGIGDVNGDGFGDVIVGAPKATPQAAFRAGAAYIFSGADGTLILQFNGANTNDYFGTSVASAGDIDGDGVEDVVVGAPQADSGNGNTGSAFVYSGATGNQLWRFDGFQGGEWMGCAVASAGDVNADTVPDFIIGAQYTSQYGLAFAGSAYVFSGADGTLLWRFDSENSYDEFGTSVSTAGDVDADGHADMIIGAPLADPHGASYAGAAYVYSGATGRRLWQFTGKKANDQLGASVSGGGDVDGDGVSDIIAGAMYTNEGAFLQSGSAYLWSGATGELLKTFQGASMGDSFGSSVAFIGDVDGDQLEDFAIGARANDPQGINSAGSVYLHSLNPFIHSSTHELSATSGSSVQLELDFPATEAGVRYIVLASFNGPGPSEFAGLAIPLTQDSTFLRLASGWHPPMLQNGFGVLDAQGNATATLLGTPSLVGVLGRTLTVAAVSFDLGPIAGRVSSSACYLTIVP
jgi:hypothetical protein